MTASSAEITSGTIYSSCQSEAGTIPGLMNHSYKVPFSILGLTLLSVFFFYLSIRAYQKKSKGVSLALVIMDVLSLIIPCLFLRDYLIHLYYDFIYC